MEIIKIQDLAEMDDIFVTDDYEEQMINPGLGQDRIIIMGPLLRIRDSKLLIANGIYCCFDEATKELEPDFALSLLYKASGEPDLDHPLYWEQDPPAIMIHNYLNIIAEDAVAEDEEMSVLQTVA